jgi:hypothetical protein
MTRYCAILSLVIGLVVGVPRGALAQADASDNVVVSGERSSAMANYLAGRHAGTWNAIATTYGPEGSVATGRLSYVGTALGDGRAAVEIAMPDGRVIAALLEYVEVPAPGPIPLIQLRQGPIDDPSGEGPEYVSEGMIRGLEFHSRLIGTPGDGSRLSVLLDPKTTFTLTVFEDNARSVEVSRRGALPPATGEAVVWDDAGDVATLLPGTWEVESWALGTGRQLNWTRRTERLPTGALLTSITRKADSSAPEPDLNTYYRTIDLADDDPGVITASVSPWTTVEAEAGVVESEGHHSLAGMIAPGVIEWRDAEPAGVTDDLAWRWCVLGRDLLVRVVRDWDGQWRWCIERRSARSNP